MKRRPELRLTMPLFPVHARTPASRVQFDNLHPKVKYVYHRRCVVLSREPDGRVKAVVFEGDNVGTGRGVTADSAYVRAVMDLSENDAFQPELRPLKTTLIGSDYYFTDRDSWVYASLPVPKYQISLPG